MNSCIQPVANCNTVNDPSLVSKPAGPVIEIDSIAIDLNCVNEKSDASKCEHFSIRGYVAEMRKKDWKICWPFPLEDDSSASFEQVPRLLPLDVPKFRSSYCQDCLQDIGAKTPNDDSGAFSNHHTTGLKSKGTSTLVSSAEVAAEVSLSHQDPDLEVVERGEIDLNKSVFVNSGKNNAFSSNDIEKEAILAKVTLPGQVNSLKFDIQKIPKANNAAVVEVNSCLIQEQERGNKGKAIITESKGKNSSALHKAGCDDRHLVCDADISIQCMNVNTADIGQTEEHPSRFNPVMGVLPAKPMSDAIEQPFQKPDDCENASSESLEVFAGNNNQDSHNDKSKGLHRKKVRKVRLLTDLLGKDEEPTSKYARTEDLSVNADAAVAAMGTVSCVQGRAIRKGAKRQNRKRKLPQDEDWRPVQTSFQINENKKIHNVQPQFHENSREESKDSDSDATMSKTISDTFSAQRTEPSTSNEKIKTKYSLYKKKGKMHQTDNEQASLGPLQNEPQSAPKHLRQDAVTKQGLHICLDNCHKFTPHAEHEQVSLLLRRDSSSKEDRPRRKDVDTNNVVDQTQYNSAQDALFRQKGSYDLNSSSTYRVPNLNEEQSYQGEHADDFPVCPMVSFGTNNGKKIAENQEHLPARSMCDDQRSAEASEQGGAIDDIPMEIVELMARNQYERRLQDSVSNKYVLEAGQRQRSQATSGRNGLIIKEKNAELPGQNLHESFSQTESDRHQKQNHNQGFLTLSQPPDWQSMRKEVSASSSSKLTGREYRNSFVDAVGHGSKHAALQDSGMLKMRASFPQRSGEAIPAWYAKTPQCMPCNIHQNSAVGQVNIDIFPNCPWHKGNLNGVQSPFLNLNSGLSRNYNSEVYARTHGGYRPPCKHNKIDLNQSPTGLLDLNCNEAMSAVQLLTLMDAGKRTGPPFDTDVASTYHKESSRVQRDYSDKCFHTVPGVGAPASIQPAQSVLRAAALTDQYSLLSQEQDKLKGLVSSSGNSAPHKTVISLGGPGENYEGTAVDRMKARTLGSSNMIFLPLAKHGDDICSTSSAACSSKRDSKPEICVVNRNPAEFTLPGSDNEYMIKPEDLKIGKKFPFKDKSRRRNMNRIAGKGRSRN